MEILILGGTRNLGHFLTLDLLKAGHQVTVFNRGQTPDELPAEVRRLRGDRSNPLQLREALARRSFDAVVDMTLYNGADAAAITELLEGRVGHYIFLSTGQVYLVRESPQRPFAEADYAGPVVKAPPEGSRDHEEWLYGVEKREAEDVLRGAWEARRFPLTSLRLPMVNSERDHFSDPWMSELDNRRSKEELGMRHTPLPIYLRKLVEYYETRHPPTPEGYRRRSEELALAPGA